jgi:hypothetical protein
VATIATVTAAVQSTWGSGDRRAAKEKLGSPTEWYVADDAATHTRYFVIQARLAASAASLAMTPCMQGH